MWLRFKTPKLCSIFGTEGFSACKDGRYNSTKELSDNNY